MIHGAGSHFETQGQLNPNKWQLWRGKQKREATGSVFAQLIALHHHKTAASQVVVLAVRTFVAGGAANLKSFAALTDEWCRGSQGQGGVQHPESEGPRW